MKTVAVFLTCALVSTPQFVRAMDEPLPVLEEVVVVGKRPGPPMWRVVNGERTLWIFGTLEPLPKSLEWDSESVSWIISQAQEYIAAPYVSASTSNPFKAIGTVRKIRKLQKLPNGQTLQDVVPADLLDDFVNAASRFAPRDKKLMALRPMFAARELWNRALDAVGLTNRSRISRTLEKIAKRHGVEIVTTNGELGIDQALEVVSDTSMEAEIVCLHTTLTSIASDLKASSERAIAWADGDASQLKTFEYPDIGTKCVDETFNNSAATMAREQARNQWLSAVERALQSNDITFASLPIRELIHPDGLLADLRGKGYEIRGQ